MNLLTIQVYKLIMTIDQPNNQIERTIDKLHETFENYYSQLPKWLKKTLNWILVISILGFLILAGVYMSKTAFQLI